MRKILLILCILLSLTSCKKEIIQKESINLGYLTDASNSIVPALNTEVVLTTVKNSLKEQMSIEAQDIVFRCHMLLDGYHDYLANNGSVINVHYLNNHIDEGPIKVNEELIDILDEAITLSKISHGYFNPTIGQLAKCYDNKFLPFESINCDPSIEDINKAVYVPYDELSNYILLNKEEMTVELKSYNGNKYLIDLGAISKGYTLDQTVLNEDSSYLINAGASSIRTYNSQNEDVEWNVAVKVPDSNEMLFSIELDSTAISTSGDDENYYLLEDGTRRHHILNPFTGYPENFYRSIVLISEDASLIDAMSTAFFSINDINEIEEIITDCELTFNTKIDYCLISEKTKNRFILTMNDGFKNKSNGDYNNHYIERIDIR